LGGQITLEIEDRKPIMG